MKTVFTIISLIMIVAGTCTAVYSLYMVLYGVHKDQRDFEKRAREEWEAMTEQERIDSGMENMYC